MPYLLGGTLYWRSDDPLIMPQVAAFVPTVGTDPIIRPDGVGWYEVYDIHTGLWGALPTGLWLIRGLNGGFVAESPTAQFLLDHLVPQVT